MAKHILVVTVLSLFVIACGKSDDRADVAYAGSGENR